MTVAAHVDLRDYQARAQNKTVAKFLSKDGGWRLLGVLPTGTGKTVVFATLNLHQQFAHFLNQFPADQRKILVIAHREELLNQAADKFMKWNPDLRVEIEQADRWASPEADVVIASIQTLASRSGRRLGRLNRNQFRLVIVDEAHHATAPSYVSVLQYFGFLPTDAFMPKDRKMSAEEALVWQRERLEAWDKTGKPPRLLLGVTATPNRADRVGLECIFQDIAFQETMLDMILQRYLSRPRAVKVETSVNLDRVHTKGGDFDDVELADAIDSVERNRLIVKAWLEHAVGRPTLAFCANVQHAHDLAAEFNNAGVKAVAVDGSTKSRAQYYTALSNGEIDVITNCNVLTEGFDEPNIQCVITARPTKSSSLYIQIVGRGTRLCPEKGKRDCLIIDVVDVTTRHSLVTLPTLFGLPAEYDAKGRDVVDEVEKVAELKKKNPLLDTSTARSLDDLELRATEVDLFGAFKLPEITDHSELSWMKVEEAFQIRYEGGPLAAEETMRVEPNDFGGWDVTVEEFGQKHKVLPSQADVASAFSAAEAWMKQHRAPSLPNLMRTAKWRNKPMSEGQRKFLNSLQDQINLPHLDTSKLNAGQGSDLIEYYKQKIRGRI